MKKQLDEKAISDFRLAVSPAYCLQPELKKMSDGTFHAIYVGGGKSPIGDPPVIGIGKTPEKAYEDFNKKWSGENMDETTDKQIVADKIVNHILSIIKYAKIHNLTNMNHDGFKYIDNALHGKVMDTYATAAYQIMGVLHLIPQFPLNDIPDLEKS
jgi:hypothetical protein